MPGGASSSIEALHLVDYNDLRPTHVFVLSSSTDAAKFSECFPHSHSSQKLDSTQSQSKHTHQAAAVCLGSQQEEATLAPGCSRGLLQPNRAMVLFNNLQHTIVF
jgi:hypothetical protein